MQAEMTDADKAIGQNMREEATDKLDRGEGHQFLFAIVAVVEVFEGDRVSRNGNDTMIGNGNTENVATEILDQLLFVIERGLDIDFPIFGQGFLQHRLNLECAVVGVEYAVRPALREFKTEAVSELIGKQFDGKEELVGSSIPAIASRRGYKRAARDDEMDV